MLIVCKGDEFESELKVNIYYRWFWVIGILMGLIVMFFFW